MSLSFAYGTLRFILFETKVLLLPTVNKQRSEETTNKRERKERLGFRPPAFGAQKGRGGQALAMSSLPTQQQHSGAR